MSFMLTTEQMRERTKDVTRRIGWWNIMRGELVQAVLQCQGLKKGETITRLCVIKILDYRSEPLDRITAPDVAREGFPKLTRREFIDLFCRANKCKPDVLVNRIEFEYVDVNNRTSGQRRAFSEEKPPLIRSNPTIPGARFINGRAVGTK